MNTSPICVFIFCAAAACAQIAVRQQGYVAFSEDPIRYLSDDLHDPVAKLRQKIIRGEAKLEWEPKQGYLRSVLDQLAIPADSQTLVFSKTSFQFRRISPKTPRALYFNDDVYVGWVQEGKALEIVSFDPMQGAIFYLLDTPQVPNPNIARAELDCTQCHVAASTKDVPGVMLRSIYANPSGTQASQSESYITSQDSPIRDRWGGWYVTGTHGAQTHMGNVLVKDREHPERIDRAAGANLTDLSKLFDVSSYLAPSSDIVAHLVLAHQTQMHNLITRTNYRARIALHEAKGATLTADQRRRYEQPAEDLLRYLLFTNEARLDEPIAGDTTFAAGFAARGPRDPRGRSLRDFDLRTRLFRYPCSYLIYNPAFDAIPDVARNYIYHRLFEVLTGQDRSPDFARLSSTDRQSIFEILLATKPGLPEEWTQKVQLTRGRGKP